MGVESGQLLSHYRLVDKIGEGGMGVVWKADDTVLHRTVAIKVLPADLALDEEHRRMFLDEARLAASVSHAHIVQVYELGRVSDLDFIVMEYVDGQPLNKVLRGKPLPVDKVAEWGLQVAEGLARAHRKGLIHRDLKPANILVTPDNEVKIVDFGLAVLFERHDSTVSLASVLTATLPEETRTRIAGTLPYMSPEQVRGEKLDARSDIFSFGTVLYEMTAGQRPFTGAKPADVAQEILKSQPQPVHQLVSKVPLTLHQLIDKALARRPEDRYQHVDDLVVDLRRLHKDIESGSSPAYQVPKAVAVSPARRLWFVLAASVMIILSLVLVMWRFGLSPFGSRAPDPGKKSWILVAEFDGPAADSALVAATRDLVMAALEQSEIVATVPRDQIRVALETAGKPAFARVDAELARELAYRSAVRTVLEGRIGRLGKGYSLIVRVVDVDSARVVLSVSDTAEDEEALIPTVSRVARRVRAELGERRTAIQATREMRLVMTPSFEAYKTLQRALELITGGDNRAAITAFRSALRLDPDFAFAWGGLAYSFSNLGEPDSALASFQQALARPERLSERWRLMYESTVALLSGDLAGALALNEQAVQLHPGDWGYVNRGAYLSMAGRENEALECFKTAEKLSPLGPNQQILLNQFFSLLRLGRVDEARLVAPRLKGRSGMLAPMWIAAAAGQWASAESLATMLRSSATSDNDLRVDAAWMLTAAQASRGQVVAAEQTLRQVMSAAETSHQTLVANDARWGLLMLALCSKGVAADPGDPGRWDSTTTGLVTQGVWVAAAGDTTLARQLLATIRTRSVPDLARQGFTPTLLQAWIAARTGRWQDALQDLGPVALQGEATGPVLIQIAPFIRWLTAEAYDQLDRPDSATAYYERAIAPPPAGGSNITQIRMAHSFGHQRLVLLYARMGRLEEARRHLEILSATFTHPDPELAQLVEEARQALAKAEAKL